MIAIIWKKSVYDNDFCCSHCGTKLFDIKKDNPTKHLGVAKGERDKLYCVKCGTLVAVFKPYDGKQESLGGEWKGEL